MTDTTNIKAQIATIEADMSKAQALADQLAAMQAAAQRVAACRRDLEQLAARLADAETAERMHAGALAKYTILGVTAKAGNPTPASAHTVTFTERGYGQHGPEEVTRTLALHGIPEGLTQALVSAPDFIPAYILALDADPYQALRKHAMHAGRGYWSAPAEYGLQPGQHMPRSAPGTFIVPGVAQL